MNKGWLMLSALAVGLFGTAAGEAAGVRPRAVVELYTSQGCSSCPPADRLMAEIAKQPDVIVLSLPVDYWDYLGWRDTLASPAYSARQRAYAGARGDRQVYTPQAVVNGLTHAVGSERAAVENAIAMTRGKAGTLEVALDVDRTANGYRLAVGGAGPSGARSGSLWLLPTVSSRAVQIGRGENSGRSVTYVNVVRGMTRLGDWTGEAQTLDVPAGAVGGDSDGFVVLLQTGGPGKPGMILGASQSTAR